MFALRMVVKCHKAFKNKRNWLATLLQISQRGLVSFTTPSSSEFNSSVPWHQQIILSYYCLSCNNLVLVWGAALTKTAAQCNASFQSQFYQCTQILICKRSDYPSAGLQLSKALTQHGTEQNHPSLSSRYWGQQHPCLQRCQVYPHTPLSCSHPTAYLQAKLHQYFKSLL